MIAHPSVVGPMSVGMARALFSMRQRTLQDGTPVSVFVLPDAAAEHDQFVKETLRALPYQLRSAWDRQVFSGSGRSPVTVSSEQEMLARVATTRGAIGYVRRELVDGQVQIIVIE
ncbi:hypothetical protein J2T57_001239 [Natronocella acetinitrilica]|uniref:Uncharacterized protein n=1 Tax=Natronocella acetinitrilica TaxID=414046 RepID=A0AAE3KFJ7_9GAMM|nr:hypothetical protein [Natronocella acetinitrilica]MCP1674137.1 hypothetical protein [Natronocella acetinitrilica]